MKIHVSNIDRSTSEDELFELFEEFGEVTSVKLNDDPDPGRVTFSAIVIMPLALEAKEAILELNGENIDGRNIRVVKANSTQLQERNHSIYDDDDDSEDDEDGGGKGWEKIRRRKPPASGEGSAGGAKGKKKR